MPAVDVDGDVAQHKAGRAAPLAGSVRIVAGAAAVDVAIERVTVGAYRGATLRRFCASSIIVETGRIGYLVTVLFVSIKTGRTEFHGCGSRCQLDIDGFGVVDVVRGHKFP